MKEIEDSLPADGNWSALVFSVENDYVSIQVVAGPEATDLMVSGAKRAEELLVNSIREEKIPVLGLVKDD